MNAFIRALLALQLTLLISCSNHADDCSDCDQSPTCESDTDCAAEDYCNPHSLRCLPSICSSDEACAPDAVCIESRCQPACEVNQDCPDDQQCNPAGRCYSPPAEGCVPGDCTVFQTCDPSFDPPQCRFTGECTDDQTAVCAGWGEQEEIPHQLMCAEGQCVRRPECLNHDDCPLNSYCEPRSDGSASCEPGLCRDDTWCPDGYVCRWRSCIPTCSVDADCLDSQYVCFRGICTDTCTSRQDCPLVGQICEGDSSVCQGCGSDEECDPLERCDFSLGSTNEEMDDPTVGLCAPR